MECTVLLVMEEICILGIQHWRMKGYRQNLRKESRGESKRRRRLGQLDKILLEPSGSGILPDPTALVRPRLSLDHVDIDEYVSSSLLSNTFHTRQEMLAQ